MLKILIYILFSLFLTTAYSQVVPKPEQFGAGFSSPSPIVGEGWGEDNSVLATISQARNGFKNKD